MGEGEIPKGAGMLTKNLSACEAGHSANRCDWGESEDDEDQ